VRDSDCDHVPVNVSVVVGVRDTVPEKEYDMDGDASVRVASEVLEPMDVVTEKLPDSDVDTVSVRLGDPDCVMSVEGVSEVFADCVTEPVPDMETVPLVGVTTDETDVEKPEE